MNILREDKKCKHCGNIFEIGTSSSKYVSHLRWCFKSQEDLGRDKNGRRLVRRVCEICKIEFVGKRKALTCSKECESKIRKFSDERKIAVSNTRKEYLKNNPDKHPWKNNDKFKSVPCENFKNVLRLKNIIFVEEWQPLEDRFFSIDIAFPDIKVGIEINGNQHYTVDGKLKPYYQDRHDIIEKSGWKLLELHFSTCFNIKLIEDIMNIHSQPDYTEYFKIKEAKKIKVKTPRGQSITQRYEAQQIDKILLVKNSDIDFTKYGWVTKISNLISIPHQKVGKWMQRFVPEIYNNAFKKLKPSAPAIAF